MQVLPSSEISYRRIWDLSWPTILANVCVPLIGATNIAVMGRMSDPKYIGGVALGVVVLQCIYWSFSFLRKGTTGITSQAFGRGDKEGVFAALVRSLLIAFILSVIVIALQQLISWFAFGILNGSEEVESLAKEYFNIRIWGSFATTGNYVMLGWLYGIQRPKLALILRVLMNIINIPLAIYLALTLDWRVAGAAYSALISNYLIFALSLILVIPILKEYFADTNNQNKIDFSFLKSVIHKSHLQQVFRINGDIFVRTVLVFSAFSWFTSAGASQGDLVLAANTILINLFWFISYALDGFANAAETLVGQAVGAKDLSMFDLTIRRSSFMALMFALIFALVYFLWGDCLLGFLTNIETVKCEAMIYMPWLVLMPLTGIACFQLDGIYTGTTSTGDMRNMMILSFMIYALAIIFLPKFLANHGLWLALHIFLIVRGISLAIPYKAMRDKTFTLMRAN